LPPKNSFYTNLTNIFLDQTAFFSFLFVPLQFMNPSIDIHQVFADYFKNDIIEPIAYECSKKLSEGNICIDLEEYNSSKEKTILVKDLLKSKWISDKEDETKAFIFKNNKVYMHRYFSYESEIIKSIKQLIKTENIKARFQKLSKEKEFIQSIFPKKDSSPNWQLVATILAYIHNFSIIAGGPGTGKTTSITKFLSLVYRINPKTKIALAAPTGKAAARIKESILTAKSDITALDEQTKSLFNTINSSTIHRLLGYQRGSHYFRHNAQNPLDFDIVIIDEASMIGVSLMAKLISSIPSGKQIIFLGDKDQLTSVEAGSVFGDICKTQKEINCFSSPQIELLHHFSDLFSEKHIAKETNILSDHIIELQKSYRFDDNKGIGQISQLVLKGKLNKTNILNFKQDEQVKFFSDYLDADFESFFELYHKYILEKDTLKALKLFSDTRLLTPIHQGEYSVDYFNQKIETYLQKKKYLFPKNKFYHNQPIIITQNNYHLQLFNGDIGLIRKDTNGVLKAYFESEDGTLKILSPQYIDQYKTVFAMTIHKSQGSEFSQVALVLPQKNKGSLLSKELLYTGLTRAKKDLWIFSHFSTLEKMSSTAVQKASGITERLI